MNEYERGHQAEADDLMTGLTSWVRENLTVAQRRTVAPAWAVAALIAGLLFLRLGHNLWSFQRWVVVEGKLEEAYLNQRQSGGKTYRNEEVRYSYKFDGKEYKGDRISFVSKTIVSHHWNGFAGTSWSSKKGKPVPVNVNPKNPQEATLLPPNSAAWWELVVYGGVFLTCIGLFVHESRLQEPES